jgi:hypothetical protein
MSRRFGGRLAVYQAGTRPHGGSSLTGTAVGTAIDGEETRMRARMLILTAAMLVIAVPAAPAARHRRIPAEAIMTLRRLGGFGWRLDIENSTPLPVVITQVRWTAPVGLQIERIVDSLGGTCARSSGGLRCRTRVEAPSCAACHGGVLTVVFRAAGPDRRWVETRSGGYWAQDPLHDGRARLVVSRERVRKPTRASRPRRRAVTRSRTGTTPSVCGGAHECPPTA